MAAPSSHKLLLVEAGLGSSEIEADPLKLIDNLTRNANAVQSQVLSAILTRNAGTEYLRGLGLSGCTDRHSFKRLVPVVAYEDLLPYIRRIANGDSSPILCAYPISEFLWSSGTSGGEMKLIPAVEEDLLRRAYYNNVANPAIKKQFVDGVAADGKVMKFLFVKPERKTPGGLLARPLSTSMLNKHLLRGFEAGRYPYTSPPEAVLCRDEVQSMYSQLVCGLAQRDDVISIGALFASSLLRVVRFMCERWEELVEDIRQKKLVSGLVTDPDVRRVVDDVLAASPGAGMVAAAEIESEFQKTNSGSILKRLWPRAKFVDTIVTGSMAQYVPTLEILAGGIPIVSSGYASSECLFGINLTPFCPPSTICYTLLPNMAFFEFLPLSEEHSMSELVDLVDVQVGLDYEPVVTTFAGLYRYRVGDVLKVEGFYNKAPCFSFVRRKNVVLAIDADKTDEFLLQRAIQTATSKHLQATGCRLLEFSSHADVSSIPGHYALFWELDCSGSASILPSLAAPKCDNDDQYLAPLPSLPDSCVFEDCCSTIENCLDPVYRLCRILNNIGPLEIRLVESGTFDGLMDYCLAEGASLSQYKTPLCVKSGPLYDFLCSKVAHSFFSPKVPHLGTKAI